MGIFQPAMLVYHRVSSSSWWPTFELPTSEVLSFDPLGAYRQGLSDPYHEGFTTHGQRSRPKRPQAVGEMSQKKHISGWGGGGGLRLMLMAPKKSSKGPNSCEIFEGILTMMFTQQVRHHNMSESKGLIERVNVEDQWCSGQVWGFVFCRWLYLRIFSVACYIKAGRMPIGPGQYHRKNEDDRRS